MTVGSINNKDKEVMQQKTGECQVLVKLHSGSDGRVERCPRSSEHFTERGYVTDKWLVRVEIYWQRFHSMKSNISSLVCAAVAFSSNMPSSIVRGQDAKGNATHVVDQNVWVSRHLFCPISKRSLSQSPH